MFAFNDESNVGDKRSASSALLLQEDEEDEDEDEEIVPEIYQQLVNKKENVEKIPEQSDAYVESRQAIEMDAWDANAWFKMLDEVKSNRSGSFTVLEACEMFLKQYPRSSSVWMLYCDTLISLKKDQAAIEEAFKKCLKQCRNVALWKSYLQYMKTVTVDAAPRENYQLERKNLEHLYDICLESVGLVIDSDGIYQSYIAFIKSWPELSAQDPGRKLAALRKVYQRCISIPINNLDGFYREYVTLEKAISEHLAEQLLPELTEKYTEAKLVYKERKRLYSCINIDFLARNRDVCTNTNIYELEQLGAWTKYIRYEMSMKESMEESQHKSLMCLVFEQCLCCFRYYPEIWMSYCNYIKSTNITSSVLPIRALFREAISIIPSCAVLRIAWAEVEEEFGNVEISRDILKQGYEATLTPIAFGALQRFIYKKDGKTAARKCFSETYPLRMEALSQSKSESRSKLGLEVYLMHAELELNLNCDPTTALSILRYAQKHCQGDDAPISSDADVSFQHSHVDFNIYYVRLMTRVLLQLGKIDEVRCVFHIAFDSLLTICGLGSGSKTVGSASGHDAEATGSHATSAAPAVDAGLTVLSTSPLPMVLTSDSIAAASTTNTSIISSAINKEVFMKTQWLLWEEFLVIENTYGINDILRLNRIRDHRSMARNAYIERFGTNSQPLVSYIGGNIRYMGYNISSTDLYLNDKNYNIYTYTMSILERYDNYSFPLISNLGGSVHNTTAHPIPNGQIDFALKERCSHEPDVIIGELSRREKDKKVDVCSAVNGTSDRNNHNHSTRSVRMKQNEEQYELLQVPLVVRDLLNKLPEKLPPSVIAATPQQMDGFISYLKNVVLPPRPMTEMEVRSGGSALGPPPLPFSNQSSQVNGRQSNSNSVLLGSMGMDEEEDEAEASGQTQIELNSSSFGFGTDFQHTATYSDMNDINGTDLFRSRHKKKMLEN